MWSSKHVTNLKPLNCFLTAAVVALTLLGAWAKSFNKTLLLDEEIIPKIQLSPFQVEVAGHSDSDKMPKKWRKNFATNWELSAARGASVVRYMIDKGVPAPRLLAAGYGPWAPHGLDSVKKQNPMWNPLTLTWKDPVKTPDGKEMPTVLSLNKNEKMKSKNRRIQITFLNPPHHGKGRSATSYED